MTLRESSQFPASDDKSCSYRREAGRCLLCSALLWLLGLMKACRMGHPLAASFATPPTPTALMLHRACAELAQLQQAWSFCPRRCRAPSAQGADASAGSNLTTGTAAAAAAPLRHQQSRGQLSAARMLQGLAHTPVVGAGFVAQQTPALMSPPPVAHLPALPTHFAPAPRHRRPPQTPPARRALAHATGAKQADRE